MFRRLSPGAMHEHHSHLHGYHSTLTVHSYGLRHQVPAAAPGTSCSAGCTNRDQDPQNHQSQLWPYNVCLSVAAQLVSGLTIRDTFHSAQRTNQLDPAAPTGGVVCQADQGEGAEEQSLGDDRESKKTSHVVAVNTTAIETMEAIEEEEATMQLQPHGQRAATWPSSSECIIETVPDHDPHCCLSGSWIPPPGCPVSQSSSTIVDESCQTSDEERVSRSPFTMSQGFLQTGLILGLAMPAAECNFPTNTATIQARQRLPGCKGQSECTGISFRHAQTYFAAF